MGERERGTGTRNGVPGTKSGERGRGAGNGKRENEKWKQNQNRERVIKLMKVHKFNFGFVPIFQLPVPYAHFRIIRLKRSEQLRH